ncbi:hypothetical protein FE784_29470 [Paenibacillus hemerocallicola]|uniref:Uncharacterized protein n=1 Tax=Paenibacillus hemerocallicola TaxID=1172614 RepID=A0A5C4T1M2_9BACL|nr:hypothetical protein [Paenibacillus hemerocallicola]TNJ62660.1 hypothetical protein FE784_29470 [Paenibacillus hemerocallicola]
MSKQKAKDEAWADAKKRCRLNDEDIRMAKELGMTPKSLTKNIPSPSEQWKAPVREWIRDLHAEKFGDRRPAGEAAPVQIAKKRSVVKQRGNSTPPAGDEELPF